MAETQCKMSLASDPSRPLPEWTHQAAQGGGGAAAAQSAELLSLETAGLTISSTIRGTIVGHASPGWEHPNGAAPGALNQALSADRAGVVDSYLQALIQGGAVAPEQLAIANQITCIDAPGPKSAAGDLDTEKSAPETAPEAAPETELMTGGVGTAQTQSEAKDVGEKTTPAMRRVDIKIAVDRTVSGLAAASGVVEESGTKSIRCGPTKSWAIRLAASQSAGGILAGGFCIGDLMNRDSGEIVQGIFLGLGPGAGATTATIPTDAGSWSDFETSTPVVHESFSPTKAVVAGGTAAGLVGVNLSTIEFPSLGTGLINTSGLIYGIGAEFGILAGTWLNMSTPKAGCSFDYSKPTEGTEPAPFTYTVQEIYTHTVYFETGSAEMSESALIDLQLFTQSILDGNPEGTP